MCRLRHAINVCLMQCKYLLCVSMLLLGQAVWTGIRDKMFKDWDFKQCSYIITWGMVIPSPVMSRAGLGLGS